MFEPSVIVIYVEDLGKSSPFYQNLLSISPKVASPTYQTFSLSNGMSLALKSKDTVEPPISDKLGCRGEIAFVVENDEKVDTLFSEWENNQINIAQTPTVLPYGYTFVALDPDDNRIRVVSMATT